MASRQDDIERATERGVQQASDALTAGHASRPKHASDPPAGRNNEELAKYFAALAESMLIVETELIDMCRPIDDIL